MDLLPQLLVNGIISGTLLAIPAIGFTAIFAVLRFPNFAVASHATIGAFAGYAANVWLGLPAAPALIAAFLVAALVGLASDEIAVEYEALGLPCLRDPAEAVYVMGVLSRFGESFSRAHCELPQNDMPFGYSQCYNIQTIPCVYPLFSFHRKHINLRGHGPRPSKNHEIFNDTWPIRDFARL